jgi:aerobic carbon-monoxide dehydrogenase large subunit
MNTKIDPDTFRTIGRPVRRKEDDRLLIGKGRFTDDFSVPNQTYAAMVRSPYPHARILGIDASAALAMQGVIAVLTGADAAADGLGPIPHDPVPSTKFDMKLHGPGGGSVFIGPHVVLPTDKARHVGEAVAMVVAETRAQALDAVDAVQVDYEELPWVTDAREAMKPGAPVVWDEAPDNVLVDTRFGDPEATDRAFAAADHVIKMDFHIGRVTAVTIEPRAALCYLDEKTGKYTLYAGSGGAVRQKREMCAVLGLPPEKVRVLSYDVGGNFGSKNRVYVEYPMMVWACKKLGRPVKFTASRSEAMLTDYQGRDLATSVELAIRKNGKFLGMRADNISNVGGRCVSLSPLSKGSALITGSYDIPAATLRSRAVFTNTMQTQAYRSSGRPEVNFAIERLIDTAARQLGFDRIALRRMNLVQPSQMPYKNAVGAVYDSGTYEANMDLAMRIHGWDGIAIRRKDAQSRGKLLGVGLSNYVESSIGAPKERAEIKINPTGRVTVVIGTQPSGQGHETSFAQVVADLISVPIGSIDVVMGDTDVVTVGGGSHSGRSMRHAGTVMAMAASDLIARGKKIAASLFNTDAESVAFKDGKWIIPGASRSYDMIEFAQEIAQRQLPDELRGGLSVGTDNEMHDPVWPNGTAICEVEVDPDTGWVDLVRYTSVDDVGRCINPLIVHGQTHGAVVQGVGQALWEQCLIDEGTGQPLCGSLMDYGMPRADNVPMIRSEIVEVLSPTNPLGIKAGGEGGTTSAPSVVVGAVVDALKDYGITDLAMPLTPFAVWQAIQAARAAKNNRS